MFKDTEKELKRLEAELLAEEETQDTDPEFFDDEEEFEDFAEGDPQAFWEDPQKFSQMQREDFSTGRIYNTDKTDEDLEEFSRQVRGSGKSITGLLITLLLLCTAILTVVIWLLFRYGRFSL